MVFHHVALQRASLNLIVGGAVAFMLLGFAVGRLTIPGSQQRVSQSVEAAKSSASASEPSGTHENVKSRLANVRIDQLSHVPISQNTRVVSGSRPDRNGPPGASV